MGIYSELDIDRQDAEGTWTAFAALNVPAWPLAGWTSIVRTQGVALGVFA